MSNPTVVLNTAEEILSLAVWFDRRCLANLAQTIDLSLDCRDRNRASRRSPRDTRRYGCLGAGGPATCRAND
jgi:hypothetical protein